jgi:hypothetical protein
MIGCGEKERDMGFYPDIARAKRNLSTAEETVEILQQIDTWKYPERAREFVQKLQALVPPGIWRHYKSTDTEVKRYAVFGVAESTEDDREWAVMYAALYPPHKGKIAFRPLIRPGCGFLVPVFGETYSGPRFTLVEAQAPETLFGLMR